MILYCRETESLEQGQERRNLESRTKALARYEIDLHFYVCMDLGWFVACFRADRAAKLAASVALQVQLERQARCVFTCDATGLVSAEILITYVHVCSEYARELERLQREQTEQEEIARIQQLAAEAEEISRYIFYSIIS